MRLPLDDQEITYRLGDLDFKSLKIWGTQLLFFIENSFKESKINTLITKGDTLALPYLIFLLILYQESLLSLQNNQNSYSVLQS